MKRFNLVLVFTLAVATLAMADEPKELTAAKAEFAQTEHPDETARVRYLTALARLREELARSEGDWKAVDAEIKAHPAPADADAKALSLLRVGTWKSHRHDYLFRKDGTWTMTPVSTTGTTRGTRGTWRIQGNQYEEHGVVESLAPDATKFTVILLTARDFIFTDGKGVFYETRKGQ